MAKQTFTVGQVLTAAQLTSLQQTAMGGGAASAKTASYTLVAADAGTTISMTSTSATTVTVNTGLFAAGDTVFIQNLGTGNLTITAGTATVATAGSLILPQNDAGILYFVSTSSSVFYDFIQVGATSPLTTKGDLYTFSTSDTRLGVGANNTILTADSAEATGLKWATPTAAGANWTLLNAGGTALTGAGTVTVSGISGVDKVMILMQQASVNSSGAELRVRLNTDTGSNYNSFGAYWFNQSAASVLSLGQRGGADDSIILAVMAGNAASTCSGGVTITGCNSSGVKQYTFVGTGAQAASQYGAAAYWGQGFYNSSSTISSISINANSGNLDAGTVYVYTSA